MKKELTESIMKRFLLCSLCIAVLGFSGCGSVRGFRVTSVNSPCLDVCVVAPQTAEPGFLPETPTDPDMIAPPPPVVPERKLQEANDDVPAPPPAELDNVTKLNRPSRKPILIPIQQTAFNLKEKVAATLQ